MLKAGTVEGINVAIAKQRRGKPISATKDTDTIIQDVVFIYAVHVEVKDDQMDKTSCTLNTFI
jgi:hypothetical protein